MLPPLARAAFARRLANASPQTIQKAATEAYAGIDGVLRRHGDITIEIREKAILYGEEVVLEEPKPNESIAHLFFRDGVRRIDLLRGLEAREINVLLDALERGHAFAGLGDDLYTYLSREELPHLKIVAVDPASAENGELDPELEPWLDGLLGEMYGGLVGEVAPVFVQAGLIELTGRTIAQVFDAIPETAGGCHPMRIFRASPSYASALVSELSSEGDDSAYERALDAALDVLASTTAEEAGLLLDGLLRYFDVALARGEVTNLVRIAKSASASPAKPDRSRAFLSACVAESRARSIIHVAKGGSVEATADLARAIGQPAIAMIVGLIPRTADPEGRRVLSKLLLEVGLASVDPIRELVNHEEPAIAQEGIFILSQMNTPEARDMFKRLKESERAEVRSAVAGIASELSDDLALETALRMLEDRNVGVRVSAAQALSKIPEHEAAKAIEKEAQSLENIEQPFEIKRAYLESYAILHHARSLQLLAQYAKKADGLLVKKEIEELGIAAVEAMEKVQIPRSIDMLKKLCTSRNRKIAEAARGVLLKWKEQAR